MAINEHWGTGFDVNRDPNAAVRRDTLPGGGGPWTRPTGRVGAYSAEVQESRSLTHELTMGGVLGLGGVHLHVPYNADIHFLDGSRGQLEDIRKGDHVAAIYHQVEHLPSDAAAERRPELRYEAIHLVIAPRSAGGGGQ
ncbi:hypothetical protein [Thiohalorhabdus methylotrophus]|uniref:Uncharacterized protein n=1 Tax=Thiohalorhabdus methylotrophus TaxID=3242694 RepID=A0ABV4TPT2_9GAMM